MSDAFITQAGPVPARADVDRWRQVALLGVAASVSGDERAQVGLAASLLALDCPVEAGRLLGALSTDDPWVRWWTVLAVGQCGDLEALGAALHTARAEVRPKGADGRDVARQLADLDAELTELSGSGGDTARFAVLGHRARPERRALIGGRSSAAYLIDPAWDLLKLVRLAPSDGPAARNAAHWAFAEVLEAVRRGEAGPGRRVPDDRPATLAPTPMLDALREDPATRDARLLRLAEEVKEERVHLNEERARLAEERDALSRERLHARRAREAAVNGSNGDARRRVAVPETAADAAALLGVSPGAARSTVQRHWREQLASCHPDRVAGLHPSLREQAQELAVALNAARELLLGGVPPRRAGRRG